MHIGTSADLAISVDTMHQYVTGLITLKKMMQMLLDELKRGDRAMYLNATEARVLFQKYVTIEYTNTIPNNRASHQFATINCHEDFEQLVLPQLSKS